MRDVYSGLHSDSIHYTFSFSWYVQYDLAQINVITQQHMFDIHVTEVAVVELDLMLQLSILKLLKYFFVLH